MKRITIGLVLSAAIVGIGCQLSAPATSDNAAKTTTASDNGTTGADNSVASQSTSGQAAAPTADIPANLQNDAFHYYGLSRPEPATYTVTIDRPNQAPSVDTGTETVKFEGMEKGSAKFNVVRTGALEQMGSVHVLLDDKGITVQSSDPGTLIGKPLDMPASLKTGATWKMDYKVDLPKTAGSDGGHAEDHSTFTVVGPQKIQTKAGNFDAIYVTSKGKDSQNGKPFSLQTQSWYVKDMGAVKVIMTTINAGQTAKLTIEATPGASK